MKIIKILRKNHMDCGMQIFDAGSQDTHAGGSGCACSALMLSAVILPKIASGEWKKVLFVPTGALLSQVSANEGRTIPAIAHAVWLESGKEKNDICKSVCSRRNYLHISTNLFGSYKVNAGKSDGVTCNNRSNPWSGRHL